MEFHFTLQIAPSSRWPLAALETLLATQCESADPESLASFLSAAKAVNPEQGEALASSFLQQLDSDLGEDFHADGVGLYEHYLDDGSLAFSFVYGDPEVAALLARFLGQLCPGLNFEIEGDYDEDPHGFKYGFKDGHYFQDEGFLADEDYDED